jgi:signal transduction histidine kinase
MPKTAQSLLLVEDNPVDVDIFKRLIQATLQPTEITHVDNLRAAILTSKTHLFDVVLLDLNLPDSQGTRTTSEFCGIFKHLPVVVLSGEQERQVAEIALSQGAQDYLFKDDLTAETLSRSIRYAMRRQKIRDDLSRRNEELFQELKRNLQQTQVRVDFISGAVHQLKAGPISLIAACVEALKAAQQEQNQEQRHQLLKTIEQAIEVIFDFLDALGVCTRDINQKTTYNPAEIQMDCFCQKLIFSVTNNAVQSVPIKLQGTDLNQTVTLDPVLLQYILQNLLDNAIKYASGSEQVDLILAKDDDWIKFAIRDRGIGIPLAEQGKVLEPFYRATNAQLETTGSGLGLSIAQSCVELHKGRLEIESQLGVGTTVYVYLPRSQT